MIQDNIIYGFRPITEAIHNDKTIDKVLIQKGLKGNQFRDIFILIRENKIPFQYVPVEKLNKFTRGNHQGIIAFMSAIEYQDIHDIIPTIYDEGRVPFLLILDKITDVRNVGAIARSAECAGVDAIILPLKGGAQLNEDAVKSSAGALHKIPICRHSNIIEIIEYLQNSGIEVVAVTEKADWDYFKKDMTQPICLVMGNEYEGIAYDYLRKCNDRIKIPMVGTIASLNVSVATGIVLFEAVKQRMRVL
ncbi:23S rRNA (guanosine(2251)-2'-O)-methyltransferase RlmB [Bacteroidales bacterium OttesenSCG-928-B11]|nr:23S rRNA (guanosine(2251)-2'-O)-methyltransferase RlmB [Bacteroidales bacterium OttesenSCG-928-C03]MDL2311825.1 23S rRNA (guanosine(2251)-2'-O)-methyltransferase RlmB [Bacteroidales bacterium OttesenSCG-928-B11]MDL2325526.1 23S rRNA (guanosine(2251)-2'-O)-methyltransferase RlmB [Bacteroidales bacterium OttesenSCG-928-A14]